MSGSEGSGRRRGGGGGCGCLGVVATAIALWALVFGVTYGGRRYDLRCDRGGVHVEGGGP